MWWRALTLLVAVALFTEPAEALTGTDLLELCETESSQAECGAYITGAIDAFMVADNVSGAHLFCVSEQTPLDVLVTMTRDYLSTHSEKIDEAATALILPMLIEGFPCKDRASL